MKWTVTKVVKILTSLGCLVSSLSIGLANAAVYQVEMIIFSHLTQSGVTQEQWQSSNPPPSFSNTLSLQNTNASGYYQALSPEQFVLKREQSEFNRNPQYRTLLHTAWLQPFAGSTPPAIHLIDNHSAVNGTVRINVNHYFNVALNLYFAVPENMLARYDNRNYFHHSNNLVYFHLTETRRMKSQELNYIDYPLFGVLIKIVPAKKTT